MVSPETIQVVANVVATVLAGLATSNAFPSLTPVFSAVAGILVGWVNAHKPGTKPKKEAT